MHRFAYWAMLGWLQEETGIRTGILGGCTVREYRQLKLKLRRDEVARRLWHTKARLVASGHWYNPTPAQRAQLRVSRTIPDPS